jgi:ATP-dependent DNA ligase
MQKVYDEIYKTDSKGKNRIWYMEQDGDRYRTWDGTQGGKIKSSEWRVAIPTNVGRSNERDGVAQAAFEIEAHYKKKLEKDYHLTLEAARSGGSHIFEAMLAEKYKTFQPGFAQPKLDGFRCIVNKDGMWSRSGKPFVSSPHIIEALAPLFESYPDLILDGELYNHELRDNFDEIQSLITTKSTKSLTEEHYAKTREMVQYHIYDIPSHPGNFAERDKHLEELFVKNIDIPLCIQLVSTESVSSEQEFDVLHGEWLEQGYEGSMWRNNTPYENRRTKNLLKRKDFVDEEFQVVAIEEGVGNWSGAAKRVICRLPDGREFGAGIKGTYERGVELLKEKHDIVTIKYFQLTPDGIPRFGVATKFHGDKREF